jgi:ketosteroid isomerase-like protein
MAKTVRAILGDIYDAWRAQNLDWLATYLPDDFCHVIHIPVDLHPLGATRCGKAGTRCGKKEAIERLRLIADRFRRVLYERTPDRQEPPRRRGTDPLPRETGAPFESTKANFWTLEDGWPVKLTEYRDIARVQAFVAAHAGAHPA